MDTTALAERLDAWAIVPQTANGAVITCIQTQLACDERAAQMFWDKLLLWSATQPATPASDGDGESALWALRQILHDLPIRRDWLDPDVERVARGLVERSPFADLTTPNPEQPGADR